MQKSFDIADHDAATGAGLELRRHPLLAGVAQTLVNAMKLFQRGSLN